jgi:hypothetical protein
MQFGKMLGRQYEKTIYRTNPYNAEYDNVEAQKLNTMRKVEGGLVGMGRQQEKRLGEGFRGYHKKSLALSVCDDVKVAQASTTKVNGRKQSVALASIASKPRDLLMYHQTDLLKNIQMENSRAQRVRELNRMKDLRKASTNSNYLISASIGSLS